MNIKDKKTKLVIGGGVALAIVISLGVGLGVGLSNSTDNSTDTPTNNSIEQQIPKANNGKYLQEKIDSFLNSGLEENIEVTNELNRLKAELDKETTNIEESKISIATQMKNHLKDKLPSRLADVEALIKEIEDNNIEVFDEVDDKLTALRNQKTKIDGMLQSENVGFEFLDGVIDTNDIKETAFVGLIKEVATYVADLTKYKTSLTQLKTKYEGISADLQTSLQTIHDNIVSKSIKISEVVIQVKTLLTTSLASMITKLTNAIESITEDEKDKYTDVKSSYDATNANLEKLNTLNTYITNANMDTVLKDTSIINTQFTSFDTIIKISNEELLTRFKEIKDDVQQRINTLVKISEGMSKQGFSVAIFNSIGTREADLKNINDGITSINSKTLTLDVALNTLTTTEDNFVKRAMKYKQIGERVENLLIILPVFNKESSNYPDYERVGNYFSNKRTILNDFTTAEGKINFEENIKRLEDLNTNVQVTKTNMRKKIEQLIGLEFTDSTLFKQYLNTLLFELFREDRTINEMKIKINNRIGEYLSSLSTSIKNSIKTARDKHTDVYPFIANKITELETFLHTIDALKAKITAGKDLFKDEITIDEFKEIIFTELTTETINEYETKRVSFNNSINFTRIKLASTWPEIAAQVKAIEDQFNAKTINVPEASIKLKEILQPLFNSIIEQLTISIASVPEDDKDLYVDVKAAIDKMIANKVKLEESLEKITESIQATFEDSNEDSSIFSEFEEQTSKTEKELVKSFVENKDSLRDRKLVLGEIKTALGETWITNIEDFIPTKKTLITDITTFEAITTYEGLLEKLKTLETKIYNEILKYKRTNNKLAVIKTEIDSLVSTPTDPTYIKLKEIYDYLKNENEVLKDLGTETGVTKLLNNINKINDSTEFNSNLVLKINMQAMVTNTPTGDTRETLLDIGEFNIVKDTGFYCGGTTQEEANTKLQASLNVFQERQTYVVKPHSIKANSNFKVTFPKYRDQENVEVDCWEVEVSDYPTLSKEPLTQEEGYKYAIVRSNINKQVLADGDTATSGKLIKKMVENTGVYCEVGVASSVAKINTYFTNYEALGEANFAGANIKGSFIYNRRDSATTTKDAYCFKLVQKALPPSTNTLTEELSFLSTEKDDFNTRVNSFKTELEALSTDTPNDARKKEALNYGIYKLTLKHGIYCSPGTTTVEEAQISLNDLSSKISSYILFIRPTTTILNLNSDVTFTKFKDEDNKVVKCWDVKVTKLIPGSKAVSRGELASVVSVHNNIHKAYLLDKTITLEERNKQMKKLYEDTHLSCTTATSSLLESAAEQVKGVLPDYRLVVRDENLFLDQRTRVYYLRSKSIYKLDSPNLKSIGYCFRVAPSSIYSFKETANQPETKGFFNANDIKVNFDTFRVYDTMNNAVQSSDILNELVLVGKNTKLSQRYQITFKDSRSDVAGKGNIYNIVFRIKKNDDGSLTIVIEDAFYRTLTNTAIAPSTTWDKTLDGSGGTKVQLSKEDIKLSFNFLQTGTVSTENAPTEKTITTTR